MWHFYEKNVIFWYFYENFGNFKILQKRLLRTRFEPRFHGSIGLCLGFIFQKARFETSKYWSIPEIFWKLMEEWFKIGHWFDIWQKMSDFFFFSILENLFISIPFQNMLRNRSIHDVFEPLFFWNIKPRHMAIDPW